MTAGSDLFLERLRVVTGLASIAFGYPNASWGEPQTVSKENLEKPNFLNTG